MTDLVPVEHHELDLRNPVTDSWTQVVEDVGMLASRIAATDFVPASFEGKPAQVAAAILHGRELGLPPMTALAQTHIVHGRPGISAEAMRGLVLQAGHEIAFVEMSSARCVIKGRRAGRDEWTTATWTIDDARQAGGLLNKNTWKSYPRQMLAARASVELCRLIFADVIHGMQALEELYDLVDGGEPAPETTTVTQVRRKPRTPKQQPAQTPTGPAASTDEVRAPSSPPERRRPTLPSPEVAESAGPSVEDQQAEIRQLSEEKRQLTHESAAGPQAEEESGEDSRFDSGPSSAAPDAEPVDAELVPDVDDKGTQLRADMAPPGHQASIIMHFKRLGVDDRAERLYWTGHIIGQDVESTKHLTKEQAVQVIKSLEVLRDRAALEATAKDAD